MRWSMIHKIKSLYDNGNGCSIREISVQLSLSRNTVRKYLRMSEVIILEKLELQERKKFLDSYREYIVFLLGKYPKLTAVRIKRKLEEKGVIFTLCDRSIRGYIQKVKQEVCQMQIRYYEPVIDMVPGVQCQVDPGEQRGILIGGKLTTVYFVVFVLSYSRLMYTAFSLRPINTRIFINMHNEAFCFFGGVVEECIYDQTKLVVIKEEFREVVFNDEFLRYATLAPFTPRACEGYDPESKGKVESGVKYVKQNFLYGEEFESFSTLKVRGMNWLEKVSNVRIHGTTKKQPFLLYKSKEEQYMRPYLTPPYLADEGSLQRIADKTSLISYKSNKYSVPMSYQSTTVKIKLEGSFLIVLDAETAHEIARHTICEGMGRIMKNTNHYRDYAKLIVDREQEIAGLPGSDIAQKMCQLLKKSSPKIYKDQLAGASLVMKKYHMKNGFNDAIVLLVSRTSLVVSYIKEYLASYFTSKEKSAVIEEETGLKDNGTLDVYRTLSSKVQKGEKIP